MTAMKIRHMSRSSLIALPAIALAAISYAEPPFGSSSPGRVYYEAAVTIDVDQEVLAATWRLEIAPNRRTGERVAFLLNRGLTIHRIEGEGVTGFEIEPFEVPHWNVITVERGGLTPPERPITLHVDYSGRLELPVQANRITPEWVELNIESMWHPLLATTDREMVGVLRIRLPPEWEVVSVGSSTLHDGVHVIRNHTPQMDIAIVAAPDFASTETDNFTAFHRGTDSTLVHAALDAAESCAAYLNPRYGRVNALPHGHLVLSDRGGSSYARGTFIVLGWIEDPHDRRTLEPGICHELAHHWTAFGNFMGPDHWMSEAFPEYVATQYLRMRFGQAQFDSRVEDWRTRGATAGPVWTADATRRPSGAAMYVLAPYLLFRLESRIGHERFAQFVESYLAQDIRATEELLRLLTEVAGAEASAAFREELAASGTAVLHGL